MHDTNDTLDASALAFQALAWALMEESRAERLLSLTGLTPEGLRASVMEHSTQAAILSFLEAYEPRRSSAYHPPYWYMHGRSWKHERYWSPAIADFGLR